MTELAQSVAAIILQEPDHARARPSRYFKDHYDNIFKPGIQLDAYVVCALLRKRAEIFLKTVESEREDRNNLLFYVLTAVRPILLKKKVKNKAVKLHEVNVQNVDDDCFRKAWEIVRPIYEKHGSTDKAAKGVEMLADLKIALKAKFSTGQKTKKPPQS